MVAAKLGDPRAVVMGFVAQYVKRELARTYPNKTAEVMGNLLVGVKVAQHCRTDLSESVGSVLAREYLRGVLTDFKAV